MAGQVCGCLPPSCVRRGARSGGRCDPYREGLCSGCGLGSWLGGAQRGQQCARKGETASFRSQGEKKDQVSRGQPWSTLQWVGIVPGNWDQLAARGVPRSRVLEGGLHKHPVFPPADSPAPPGPAELQGPSGSGPPHWGGVVSDGPGHRSPCTRCP